jgi:molybdopterin converting factor small subunit
MQLRLLLFGITKDIIGESPYLFELSKGDSVGELIDQLIQEYPALINLNSLAIAVNGEYASKVTLIKPSDEVALIPPVSGG